MRRTFAFASLLAAASFAAAGSSPRSSPERAAINDNRTPAGTLRDGVLTLRLEARESEWHPDGERAPGIIVRAFAERGKRASIPGPLIRVPEGTEIRASVTNTLAQPLAIRGLATRGVSSVRDTIVVAGGATRELRFVAGAPGTYYYSAENASGPDTVTASSAELSGAFVIDPRGAAPPKDRVFLIALWRPRAAPAALVGRRDVLRFTINGRSWPNTERLAYSLGDTVRFRIINASTAVHPMHLHGFYFDVTSRGDGTVDSVYASGAPPYRVVTERTRPGRTFTMTWVATRAGNWLFHCHDNFHVLRNVPLDGSRLPDEHLMHVSNHATDMMGGLVMGIEVRGPSTGRRAVAEAGRRQLRLVAQEEAGGTDSEPSYGYVLHEGARATSAVAPILPGLTIVLKRGDPVTITIVNHLDEPTAVHWHGIELESYFDGVADFSGSRGHIAHAIAPGDSFAARFTPPRSGTFMYHPHADEVRQQQAGLTGALLVVDDPAAFDSVHDKVLLITVPRLNGDGGRVMLNGSLSPAPLELRVGERYRFRLINVHPYRPSMITRLLRDSTLVTWRAIAKDGMDLPPERATERPATQQLGNGETYDFELVPREAGTLRFTVT
ncbi:MAG TPA: multicopper oxidase domain-containing protein, partial [Gemmatimonadaceae bacterium]|nr:multicopper oxidase domain-containing protein [Gemmatimonadaceae bacterium]